MYIQSRSNQKGEIYSPATTMDEETRNHKRKNHLENLRNTSRDSNHNEPSARQSYQAARNNYKKAIRSKRATFLQKALSSAHLKEVWEMVNRILDPP